MSEVPTVSELSNPARFSLIAAIGHADVAGAIRPYLRRVTLVTTAYWLLNLAVLVWLVLAWRRSGLGLLSGFPTVSLGMVGAYLVLVPLHELLHAAGYRLAGARGTRVQYSWRRMTAQCVADGFVVGRTWFAVVCLLPLVVLNAVLVAIALALPTGVAQLTLAAALLLHTGAASGDVALVNLLWTARGAGEIWTYDDVAGGMSYFYAAEPRTHEPEPA